MTSFTMAANKIKTESRLTAPNRTLIVSRKWLSYLITVRDSDKVPNSDVDAIYCSAKVMFPTATGVCTVVFESITADR